MEHRADTAGGSAATYDVFHHVDHQPRLFRRHHGDTRRSRLPQHVALLILDARNCCGRGARPESGKGGVCGDHLDRIDGGGADVYRGIRRDRRRNAEAMGLVDHTGLPELHAEPDGGEVARLVEGAAEGYLPLELAVVVLRVPRLAALWRVAQR